MPGIDGKGMFGVLARQARETASRTAWAGGMAMMALVFVAIGVGFLATALFLVLTDLWTPPLAALATAAAVLAVAGILLLIARARWRGPTTMPAHPDRRAASAAATEDPAELAARLGADLGVQGVAWARRHPLSSLAIALAAGAVVGANPELRRELSRWIEPNP